MSKYFLSVLLFMTLSLTAPAQAIEKDIQHYVDSIFAINPQAAGLQLHVEAPDNGISFSYAVGSANRTTHQKLSPNTPILIASNTKPYVSAAILKLVELGKLDVEQPVSKLLNAGTNKTLIDAGYHTEDIYLKHLLSHTSGLRDYVSDDYFAFISSHKKHEWKRDDQIALAAKAGKPLASPGDTFHYADINYVLLTEVIERQTKLPFYKAIRSLLNYRALNLKDTWFAKFEHGPAGTNPRAHQYWDKFGWDTYDLDPSWDLYGGGGIIATEKDMAMFFQKLFNGQVISKKEILALMYTDVPPNLEINYCHGIRKIKVAGFTGYNHGGGLGTDVVYIPKLNATVAVAALEASHRPLALEISKEIVRRLGLLQNAN